MPAPLPPQPPIILAFPAANALVERLVKIGILSEVTGQARNRRFRYDAYVHLFDEPVGERKSAGPFQF